MQLVGGKITASRGEVRSILITLKQIEIQLIYETGDTMPILLLDDVFSELDTTRQGHLLRSREVQTILTTTALYPGLKSYTVTL